MAMGGMPVKRMTRRTLERAAPMPSSYPCYDLLPGSSGAGRERSSLIVKDFSRAVTDVTRVTSKNGIPQTGPKWLGGAGRWRLPVARASRDAHHSSVRRVVRVCVTVIVILILHT